MTTLQCRRQEDEATRKRSAEEYKEKGNEAFKGTLHSCRYLSDANECAQ